MYVLFTVVLISDWMATGGEDKVQAALSKFLEAHKLQDHVR